MAPRLDVGDAVVFEGNSGTVEMVFTVQLASPAEIEVRVSYTTADGSARAGSDYVSSLGTLTIPQGTTEAAIAVTIIGDTILEHRETLFLSLYSPHGAILGDSVGEGIIVNDDRPFNLPHPPRAE
jgi:chitinase